MNIGIIVFSRMSSSRLPGKALRHLGGLPLVERVLRRASLCGLDVCFATSTDSTDNDLAEFVKSIGYKVFRGDLNDVLTRATMAAETFGFDYFFRICGDRPLFNLNEILSWTSILKSEESGKIDLITNYTLGLATGLTNELISTKSLCEISKLSTLTLAHKEHVTNFFYEFSSKFNIIYYPSEFINLKFGSLAIDTSDDFRVISKFFDFYPEVNASTKQAVNYLGLN